MEKIVLEYLNKNYVFTLSTHQSYILKDKINNSLVKMADILKATKNVFSINEDELIIIFDKWAEEQTLIINNKITDIRYRIYEKTGMELTLTPEDLNKIMSSPEFDVEFNKI